MNNALTSEQAAILHEALLPHLNHLRFMVRQEEGSLCDERRRWLRGKPKGETKFTPSQSVTDRIETARKNLQAFLDAMSAAGIAAE